MRFVLKLGIASSVILYTVVMLFAQTEIAESDRKAIWVVLDELGQAIVREDIDSILSRLSPNIDREEYNNIKEAITEKFSSYDYTEYKFSPPAYQKIKILEQGRQVRFKTGYSEKYKRASGSGSSSGFSSNFVMEKIKGEWLILNTDFHTKERAMKLMGIILGFFVLLGIGCIIFWFWMLIDCIKRDFIKPDDKVIWVLLIIFIQIIGAIIYYFMVRRKSQ